MLLFLLALFPTLAGACGGFFCSPNQPVVQSGEAIVFGVQDRTVSMHVQINYQGPSEAFGWFLPVMFRPNLYTNTTSEVMFQKLFEETLPTFNFTVDTSASNCPKGTFDEFQCPIAAPSFDRGVADQDDAEDGGIVEEAGTVGPFDYTILKTDDVNELLGWLETNNFDQYEGSEKILTAYLSQYFVALRLSKESEAGDIVPIVLEYDIPEDTSMDALTCIPLVMTSLATTPVLPIHVYLLGETRADPVNFFQVELDDTKVDWLGCQNPQFLGGGSNAACFDQDYRSRASAAFAHVDDHAFIVEYAGPSSLVKDLIAIDIDVAALAATSTPLELMNVLLTADIPSYPMLDALITEYIPQNYNGDSVFQCGLTGSVYNPGNPGLTRFCAASLAVKTVDSAAFAEELNTKVVEPSKLAESFVAKHPYLTKMYVSMREEVMNKDPIFSFRSESEDVSNMHSAVGVPVCNNESVVESMTITLDDGTSYPLAMSYECDFVVVEPRPFWSKEVTPARQLLVAGFGEEEGVTILPEEGGSFNPEEIVTAIEILERRESEVMGMGDEPDEQPLSPPNDEPVSPPVDPPVEPPVDPPVTAPSASSSSLSLGSGSLLFALI